MECPNTPTRPPIPSAGPPGAADRLARARVRLSDGQLDALRNLSIKQDGGVVDWISIAAARGLTDLGFAERTQSGWRITSAGAAALGLAPSPRSAGATVVRDRFPQRVSPAKP